MKSLLFILALAFSFKSFAEVKEYSYICATPQGRIGYDNGVLKLKGDPQAKDLQASTALEFSVDEALSMPPGEKKFHQYKLKKGQVQKSTRTNKNILTYKDKKLDFSATIVITPYDAQNNSVVSYRDLIITIVMDDVRFECSMSNANYYK